MSRSKAEHPRDQTLLLRLTTEQRDVLESAAHLGRTTPNGYAYKLLSDHLATLATQPHVAADRENRAAFDVAWAQTVPITAGEAAPHSSRGKRSRASRGSAAPPS